MRTLKPAHIFRNTPGKYAPPAIKGFKLIVLLVQMSFFGYVSAFQPFQHSGGNEYDFAT